MVVVGSVGDNMVVGGLGAFEGYTDGGCVCPRFLWVILDILIGMRDSSGEVMQE